MLKLAYIIFFFSIIALACTQPQVKLYFETREFKEAAEECVRLHLVEELSRASEMSDTYDGRQWLRSWLSKKYSIFTKHFFNSNNKFLDHLKERLNRFQELQMEYFQKTIVSNYDKRRSTSPWPRMTFDVSKFKTIIHPDQPEQPVENERDLADPFATEKDIDEVLRFHRPVLKKTQDVHETKKIDKNVKYPKKKYYIINNEKIHKLQSIHYELMRKSLQDKRKSYLDYHEALIRADRITVYFNILTLNKLHYKNDKPDNKLYKDIPLNMLVLKYDEAYKNYLNYDDTFFGGNIIFGPMNRFDDPKNHGLDFEENAELLIGKRFGVMRDLAQEIHDFSLKSQDFTKIELQDFITINSILENFKTLTFWFIRRPLVLKQWLLTKTESSMNNKIFMIKPVNMKSKNHKEIYNKVDQIMSNAKSRNVRDLSVEHPVIESERLQKQLTQTINLVRSGKGSLLLNLQFLRCERIINYFNTKSYVNTLSSLSFSSSWIKRPSISLQPRQRIAYQAIPEFKENTRDKTAMQMSFKNDVFDDVKKKDELFDIRSIISIQSVDDKSKLDGQSISIYDSNKWNTKNQNLGNGGDGDGGYFNPKRPFSSEISDVAGNSYKRHQKTHH